MSARMIATMTMPQRPLQALTVPPISLRAAQSTLLALAGTTGRVKVGSAGDIIIMGDVAEAWRPSGAVPAIIQLG